MKQSRLARANIRKDLIFLSCFWQPSQASSLGSLCLTKWEQRTMQDASLSECYGIHTSPTTIPSSISSWNQSTCSPSQTTQNGSVDMFWVSGSTAWLVLLFLLFFSNLNIFKHLCPEHQEPSEEQLWNPEALTAPPNKAHGSTL